MAKTDFEMLPVKFLMENDILSDIVYNTDTLNNKLEKVSKKIQNSPFEDFFLVVLENETDKYLGVITMHEFSNLALFDSKTKNKLDFHKPFSNIVNTTATIIQDNKTVKDVLSLFELEKSINVLPVLNSDNKYVGKIFRRNLNKRLEKLFKSFQS